MVMITFSLIVFFNVKVSLFFGFFNPFVFFSGSLVTGLFIVVFCFFFFVLFFSLFFLLV